MSIRIVFTPAVLKISALEQSCPGGLQAFLEHYPDASRDEHLVGALWDVQA